MMSEERIEKLREMLENNPEDTFVLFALGMEYVSRGDGSKARECFERLLKIDDNYVPAYFHLAKLLLKIGERERAKEVMVRGVKKAEENAQFHTRDKLKELLEQM